jgi:hypothetical protein
MPLKQNVIRSSKKFNRAFYVIIPNLLIEQGIEDFEKVIN